MADQIRYDLLTQQALRDVVRRVLADTAKKGLPGEHHFYITFDTDADGVRIPPRLREQFPENMTIILQHQFWDLKVADEEFEVGLSFGGIPEKLTVPFAAITAFFDPSVQFGLQFEEITEEQTQKAVPANSQDKADPKRPAVPAKRAQPSVPAVAEKPAEPEQKQATVTGGGAEVVRLDRFRKNKK
jgi:hypothetical protein